MIESTHGCCTRDEDDDPSLAVWAFLRSDLDKMLKDQPGEVKRPREVHIQRELPQTQIMGLPMSVDDLAGGAYARTVDHTG